MDQHSDLRFGSVPLTTVTITFPVSSGNKPSKPANAAFPFPLAVAGNGFRLALIILAAEVAESAQPGAGQAAGNFVHSNGFLSLLPYVPAFVGVLILGRVVKEDGESGPATEVAIE
mgnify:CR=1 FL=1